MTLVLEVWKANHSMFSGLFFWHTSSLLALVPNVDKHCAADIYCAKFVYTYQESMSDII